MKAALLLSLVGASQVSAGDDDSFDFTLRYGDRFGDGWSGVSLGYLKREENGSVILDEWLFNGIDSEDVYTAEIGDREEVSLSCEEGEEVYFGMVVGPNNTLVKDSEMPLQYWEIYFQVEKNDMVYHGGWNTLLGFRCNGVNATADHTLLDFTENLLEPIGACPKCTNPTPKPKPKPKGKAKSAKGSDDSKGSDDMASNDDINRRLSKDDDKEKESDDDKEMKTDDDKEKESDDDKEMKTDDDEKENKADDDKSSDDDGNKKRKTKPVPVKLYDSNGEGWFNADSLVYAEYTISDTSRVNLLAEGTLCPAKGYSDVCETQLPDGQYIFRASGHLDEFAYNFTWDLCGKKATGSMGNEVTFHMKKGKCYVGEVITIDDYLNGTALDTVLTLDGHILLENVHFDSLSAVESYLVEADIDEFVNLEIEKTVSLTSVENMEDGTLLGYRIVAAHAESQFMHGTMDDIIYAASDRLSVQTQNGGFVTFLKNSLQSSGMSDDKLMTVSTVSFIDLDFAGMVTLHNGETSGGDVVAGGRHSTDYNPIVSGDKVASASATSASGSSVVFLDVVAASGAFVVLAVVVAAVVVTLRPPTTEASDSIDNSSTNLVAEELDTSVSLDVSSTDLLAKTAEDKSPYSYENSLSAALSQRWQLSSEEDSLKL